MYVVRTANNQAPQVHSSNSISVVHAKERSILTCLEMLFSVFSFRCSLISLTIFIENLASEKQQAFERLVKEIQNILVPVALLIVLSPHTASLLSECASFWEAYGLNNTQLLADLWAIVLQWHLLQRYCPWSPILLLTVFSLRG